MAQLFIVFYIDTTNFDLPALQYVQLHEQETI